MRKCRRMPLHMRKLRFRDGSNSDMNNNAKSEEDDINEEEKKKGGTRNPF